MLFTQTSRHPHHSDDAYHSLIYITSANLATLTCSAVFTLERVCVACLRTFASTFFNPPTSHYWLKSYTKVYFHCSMRLTIQKDLDNIIIFANSLKSSAAAKLPAKASELK